MIELINEFKKQLEKEPLVVEVEISKMNKTLVHCVPVYMYGQSDLIVKPQYGCKDSHRISRKVQDVEFFTFVTTEQLKNDFPHLAEEVLKCPNSPV